MASTSYHFTKESPPQELLVDFNALQQLKDAAFKGVVDAAFAFLTQPSQSARLLEQIEALADEHGVATSITRSVVRGLLGFAKLAIKNNCTPAFVAEDLVALGLSDSRAEHMADLWKANQVALSRAVVAQALMVNQLVDMEWKFGVTAGTNDVKRAGTTFLQLKLVIDKGTSAEDVYLEMTLRQFYQFLHEMEKAKSNLEIFS